MNTTELPQFFGALTMPRATQRGLFDDEGAAQPQTGLFAEVVFDRPLDHAYSYAVPEELRSTIAIGKRVLAPFGKGDRATVGFCVGLSEKGPEREVKELRGVVDAETLLTP